MTVAGPRNLTSHAAGHHVHDLLVPGAGFTCIGVSDLHSEDDAVMPYPVYELRRRTQSSTTP